MEVERDVRCVPPGEARSLWFNGGLVKFYALGEETGGAFTLFEEATAPGDSALPHLHHEEDQAFYVLQGEHEFTCDGRTLGAEAGSVVYVPRGVVHSFANVGSTAGRLLIFSTPAGGTESFFFEVGQPAEDETSPPPDSGEVQGLEDITRLREIARRHGSDIDTLALLQQLSAGSPRQATENLQTARGGEEDE